MPKRSSLLYYLIFISIGFLYPAYCSLVALETPDRKDDSAWLMFWVVFALFNIFEFFADMIFSWFPLYSVFKIGFLAWCVAPIGTNGAFHIFKVFVAPVFRAYGGHVDYYLTQVVELSKDAAEYIPSYPK